jgi:hypothetical protein
MIALCSAQLCSLFNVRQLSSSLFSCCSMFAVRHSSIRHSAFDSCPPACLLATLCSPFGTIVLGVRRSTIVCVCVLLLLMFACCSSCLPTAASWCTYVKGDPLYSRRSRRRSEIPVLTFVASYFFSCLFLLLLMFIIFYNTTSKFEFWSFIYTWMRFFCGWWWW